MASGLTCPTNPDVRWGPCHFPAGRHGLSSASARAAPPSGEPRHLHTRAPPQRPAGPQRAGRALTLSAPVPVSQDLEDLEEAEEPDLEEDDDQKAVKDEL